MYRSMCALIVLPGMFGHAFFGCEHAPTTRPTTGITKGLATSGTKPSSFCSVLIALTFLLLIWLCIGVCIP